METQDIDLKEIQAKNDAALKKLDGFRSGLQKLMNKKSKKSSKHQMPSHDTKSPENQLQKQYFQANSMSSPTSQYNSQPTAPAGDFGFNSTLFRQIGDESVVFSNPSGINAMQFNNKFPAYNSVPNTEYFSASSKQSGSLNEPKFDENTGESFKKASQLYSQIDKIMNKVNKTSKLPVKPIQKYFDKIESNLSSSNLEDFDLHLSKSATKFEQDLKLSPRKDMKGNSRIKEMEERNENKTRSVSAKDEIKNATSFLKNFKEKSDFMRSPPLPPPSQKQEVNKKHLKNQQKIDKLSKKSLGKQNSIEEQQFILNTKSLTKSSTGQNSVEIHRNKIKQTLNERKKMIKDQGMQDDSIELQLSEQDQNENEFIEKQDSQKRKERQIETLIEEKQKLLKQLQQIQEELQKLENQ